jgi:hypothetical protein
MVESPSSHRTVFTGNHTTIPYTKPTNEYVWCYENSNSMQVNNGTSFDECLPQLEIDDKPLIYRQQFESMVCRERFLNKEKYLLLANYRD